MTTYITLINSEGDIVSISTSGGVPSPAEGTYEQDNSLTVVHLPGSITSLSQYRDTHYYKDGAFVAREPAPDYYYTWALDTESWVLDSEALLLLIREQRNHRLSASDWTQLPDAVLSDEIKAAWVTHRTILRNIPADSSGVTHIDEVTWPAVP